VGVTSELDTNTSPPNYGLVTSPQRRPPQVTDEFLTVAEVAAILRLNQQTVRNWIEEPGKLPAVRIGRRVRVLRRDLNELIAEGEAALRTSRPAAAEHDEGEGWRDAREFWGGG
jgi:excisionase family DNA binding protein